MRQEKKKQKQIEKQNKQSNPNMPPEFGESMTRLQKKIDDLTSHRRQMDEVDEEDIVNEANIEKMHALNNSKDIKDNNKINKNNTNYDRDQENNMNMNLNRQQKQIHDCSYE